VSKSLVGRPHAACIAAPIGIVSRQCRHRRARRLSKPGFLRCTYRALTPNPCRMPFLG